MAAPKGNKFGCGKKGRSGRKSMYEESTYKQKLVSAWFEKGVSRKALTKALSKDKVQLFKVYLAKALSSDRILSEMFHKLFPTKQDITTDGQRLTLNLSPSPFVDGTIKEQRKERHKQEIREQRSERRKREIKEEAEKYEKEQKEKNVDQYLSKK